MNRTYFGLSLPIWALVLTALMMINGLAYHQYGRAHSQQRAATQTLNTVQGLASQRPTLPSAASLRSYWSNATFTSDNTLSLSAPDALLRMRDFGVTPRTWSWDATSSTLTLEYDLAP